MTTTTIRIPQELKERVSRAAERNGTTAHSFILEAIAEKAEQDELRADFRETARQRYEKMLATGMAIPWEDMRRYLEARIAGKKAVRPKPRSLARK